MFRKLNVPTALHPSLRTMLYVSIFIELLRSRPRVTFWMATLFQAAIWWLLPSIFYAAPPGDLPTVLAVGHEFQLGTWQGPPLAFWLAEIACRIGGLPGVYLLAQLCVIVTYWAVFALARSIVGIHQAVIAILLMVGISTMTLPTADFGPGVLAMPLTALVVASFWQAIGEGRRNAWFLLAIEVGLLLLTTYAGLVLLGLIVAFIATTRRGRAILATVDPWRAGIVIMVMLFPHLIWLDASSGGAIRAALRGLARADVVEANLSMWLRTGATVAASHAGVIVLVALATVPWFRGDDPAPTFVRDKIDPFARRFVFFFAIAPVVVATIVGVIVGDHGPIGGLGPHVILSGLAVVIMAGPVIAVQRHRIVGFAWGALLVVPAVVTVASIVILPWTVGIDLRVSLPARNMGRFFADTFERSTGRPLQIVTGDRRLVALVAIGARERPSVYDYARPDRTPWVGQNDIRRNGAIIVWPAADTAGTPPADIRAHFPELQVGLPRAFEYLVQGRLPLLRVGWGIVRPQSPP